MDDNRRKALDAALGQIDRQFGKGSVMRLGDTSAMMDVSSYSTGSLGLDIALGIGGLPRGRVIEIYGPESSGKTTLTLSVIAEAQKQGGTAAFIDAEHALDPAYAERLGVNIDDLLVSQPDTGDQALEITDMLVRSAAVDVVVVDSVAALTPKAEIEGDMGDHHVGLQARLMSQALRKLTANIKRANTMVIFINQIRMKIGVMFGNPETTTGGNALKFYSSVRMDIRRIGAIKKGDDVLGNQTRVKVVKNKVAPPFKKAEFDILYNEGISKEGELIDLGIEFGIVEKSGAWYSYGSERIGQGRDNVREFLKTNVETAATIEAQIRAKLGLGGGGDSAGAGAGDGDGDGGSAAVDANFDDAAAAAKSSVGSVVALSAPSPPPHLLHSPSPSQPSPLRSPSQPLLEPSSAPETAGALYNTAYRYLARREHSAHELRRKLQTAVTTAKTLVTVASGERGIGERHRTASANASAPTR